MSRAEFDALWDASGGFCAITGLKFSMERIPGKLKRPWAPSVDRIDNRLGYVRGNCQIVCTAVNIAMNEWGIDVLHRIAFRVVARYKPPIDRAA